MEQQKQQLPIRNPLNFKSCFVNFKLQYMLEDLFYHYRFLASEKLLECFLVVPENLKRSFKADPVKIEYIISSLLAHSIECTEKGRIDIMVSQRQQFGNVVELCFVVQDTGTGVKFDNPTVAKHYESKMSLESLESENLNKVFKMAEYIGGKIQVKSSGYHKGVQFNFIVPLEIVN